MVLRILYGSFFFLSFMVYRNDGSWFTAIMSLLLVYLAYHSPERWTVSRISYNKALFIGVPAWIFVLVLEQMVKG
jgi:predicted transporter